LGEVTLSSLSLLRLPSAFLLAFISLTVWGCDPCSELADRICDCEETPNAKLRCQQEREVQRNQREVLEENQEACAAALQTCNCEALEQNQVDLCGMTRETQSSEE